MKIFDLYGIKSKKIKQLAIDLEGFLNIQWELHHSSFIGEYYLFKGVGKEKMTLEPNYNEEYGWREAEFTEYRTLLYVSYSNRYKEIEDILLNRPSLRAKLLKRTIVS